MKSLFLLSVFVCLFGNAETIRKKFEGVINPTLINGEVIDSKERPDIVSIRTGSSGCSASVAGPRVVITASHCGSNFATTVFSTNGKSYKGTFYRSKLYPRQDHDVAVIVTTEDVDLGGKPYTSVGGVAKAGDKIYLYGYGCIKPGGGGADGKLRKGDATIKSFSNFDLVSTSGSALCYGDSVGPDYMLVDGKEVQISVNSKGNIRDTNYTTRLDVEETKKFFEDIIAIHKVEICGVNKVCGGAPIPPEGLKFSIKGDTASFDVQIKDKDNLDFVRTHTENLRRFLDGDRAVNLPYED